MQEKEPITSVNRTQGTQPVDSERTLATPHFDAAAVQHARPAVPLAEIRAHRNWPLTLIALAVLAGLVGGVIGGALATGYLKRDTTADLPAETTANTSEVSEPVAADSTVSPRQEANEAAASSETAGPERKRAEQNTEMARAEDENAREAPPEEARTALRSALNEWLAATNARNLSKQLSFYQPTMDAFYRRRNARLEEVRADRARVFERAETIDVRADAPSIQLSPDGRSATMRFRKRYNIAGGGLDRSGEVVQELRWQRVGGRWRIASERDVKVVQ